MADAPPDLLPGPDLNQTTRRLDLTSDSTACALLRALARQPWRVEVWQAVYDHLEENGREVPHAYLEFHRPLKLIILRSCGRFSRRQIRRQLLQWRKRLIEVFGDFEKVNTL